MGTSASVPEDPRLAVNAGRRQTALTILIIAELFFSLFVLALSFWQVSDGGVSGGPPGQGVACPFRPAVYTQNGITTTCIWNAGNSAVRILAGFASLALWGIALAKTGWWRTDRKIFLLILMVLSFVLSTAWLVLAGWDANEVRLSNDSCKALNSVSCDYAKYIGTVLCNVVLWLIGWALSIVFAVWYKKEDFRRPVGMCVRRADSSKLKDADFGNGEMEAF